MDSCYSLPFLLKCYERLGGVMSVCPRAAAARRRRGVLARAAYAMRKARYADVPRLPLARAGSIGDVLTLSPAPPDVSQGARARSPDSEPRRKKRRRRRRARPARGALPPRHVLDAAELGAAAARCLELMPKARAEAEPAVWPVWAAYVNTLATVLLADLSPEFDRVCLCAARAGRGPFLALPLRGYLGWRRRARLAGYA